jgi:hypothetical protein
MLMVYGKLAIVGTTLAGVGYESLLELSGFLTSTINILV